MSILKQTQLKNVTLKFTVIVVMVHISYVLYLGWGYPWFNEFERAHFYSVYEEVCHKSRLRRLNRVMQNYYLLLLKSNEDGRLVTNRQVDPLWDRSNSTLITGFALFTATYYSGLRLISPPRAS